MPLNWNDSTVPGWQTMWQLTPVGIASADRSAHDINEGLREMARLSHSRTEGMLNRKAQKDAQKRQEKQQKSMFKRQVGTQVGLGLATAGLSAGIGAIAAPAVEAPVAATSQGVSSSLEPVMEGAGTLSSSSAPIAESVGTANNAVGGLAPIAGTGDMTTGIPSFIPTESGGVYADSALLRPEFQGGIMETNNTSINPGAPSTASTAALTPVTPDPHISAVGDNLANTRNQLRGQMGTGMGGDTTGLGAPVAGDFWSRFGKNFGMNMLGQSPYWAMMGRR